MKYTLTLALFLGLITSETAAIRIEHKSHHKKHHKHHNKAHDDAWVDDCQPGRNPYIDGNGNAGVNAAYPGVGIECQGFSQKKKHQSLSQYKGNSDAWIDDCDPDRDVSAQSNPSGAGSSTYPGVGVECQGFAQKKSHSLAQYKGSTDAWIDDCSPDRVMDGAYGSGTQGAPNALPNGSYTGVGVECQGFAQRKSHSLAQYKGNSDAWIDDCDPDRDVSAQSNPSGAGSSTYPGVGVECQGFAQKKSHSLAQYKGNSDAWIDDCDPNRDVSAATNPSGAGTYEEGNHGSFPGVGVECQGFAQKKSRDDAWVDDCQPGRNPYIDGNGNAGVNAAYPGVGIECQGFSQKKKQQSLAQYKGSTDAWIDDCDPNRDVSAATNPSGAGTYETTNGGSFPGVGVECQGFAQRKSMSLAQYKGSTDAWIDDCDPNRDVSAATNPSGAGTYEATNNGSFPGVGVECQGFAQRSEPNHHKINLAQYKGSTDAWIDDCDPNRDVSAATNPSGAGTYEEGNHGSFPGVGVECQGFAQIKSHHKKQHKSRKHSRHQKHSRECDADWPECNGTNGVPGVSCCDE